jgi:hypothetical protein
MPAITMAPVHMWTVQPTRGPVESQLINLEADDLTPGLRRGINEHVSEMKTRSLCAIRTHGDAKPGRRHSAGSDPGPGREPG